MARAADAGVTRVLFPLPSLAEAEAIAVLDQYAKLLG